MKPNQPTVFYPLAEFGEAFAHAGSPTAENLRALMTPWFKARYPNEVERAKKLKMFLSVCDYLKTFRTELNKGEIITETKGNDMLPGALIAILLRHFQLDPTPPKPEQVVAACIKRARHIQPNN